jgi:hypothetical protein
MVSVLFPEFKREVLSEDKDDQYESYTGIVIDPVHNEFKVITGDFLDKKDMYTKLTKKGYIVRKSFETRVWKWMEKNAPSNLVAYMMFSTAFSKWKNNNVLGPYYVKLLNDIPQLNREREKGDPNTTGDKLIKLKKESVLEEDANKIDRLKQLTYDNLGVNWNDFFLKNQEMLNKVKYLQDKEEHIAQVLYNIVNDSRGEFSEKDSHEAFEEIIDEIDEVNEDYILRLPTNHKTPTTDDFLYKFTGYDKESTNPLFKIEGKYKAKVENGKFDYFYDPSLIETLWNLSKQPDINDSGYFSFFPEADIIDVKIFVPGSDNLKYSIDLTSKNIRSLANKLEKNSDGFTGYGNKDTQAAVKNKGKDKNRIVSDDIQSEYSTSAKLYQLSQVSNPAAFVNSWSIKYPYSGEISYPSGLFIEIDGTEEGTEGIINDLDKYLNEPFYTSHLDPSSIDNSYKFVSKIQKSQQNLFSIYLKLNKKTNGKLKEEISSIEKPAINALCDIWVRENNGDAKSFYKNIFEDAFNLDLGKKWNIDDESLAKFNETMHIIYDVADKARTEAQRQNRKNDPENRTTDAAGEYIVSRNKAINNINPKHGTGSRNEGDTITKNMDLYNQLGKEYRNLNMTGDNEKIKRTKDSINQAINQDLGQLIANPDVAQNNRVADKDLINSVNIEALRDFFGESDIKTESFVNDGATALLNSDRMASERMYNTPSTILPMRGTIINEDSTHNELNQSLFDGTVLREDVRNALLKISDKFLEYIDIPFKPVDTFFTGSCANYNYNDNSDIDLHLVFDYEKVGINEEILDKYLKSAKNNFNKKYSISVKGIPVELGCENVNEPLVSTGVYSLVTNKWISKPSFKSVEFDDMPDDAYLDVKEKLETIISSKDIVTIQNAVKSLGKLRKVSLKNDGEFGIGNLLFKRLRADGVIENLKNAYYDSESKELSLESMEDL